MHVETNRSALIQVEAKLDPWPRAVSYNIAMVLLAVLATSSTGCRRESETDRWQAAAAELQEQREATESTDAQVDQTGDTSSNAWNVMVQSVDNGLGHTIEYSGDLTTDQVKQLQGLSQLRHLKLTGEVDRSVIDTLPSLSSLQTLYLAQVPVDETDITHLTACQSLDTINLPTADFNDDALAALAQLPRLELLRIGSPRVTAQGFGNLQLSKSLRFLHVIEVPVDEAVLEHVMNIQQLESFYADGANAQSLDWETVFKSRPDLHVHVNQVHDDRDPQRGHDESEE